MPIQGSFDQWILVEEKSPSRAKVEYTPEPGSSYYYDLEHGGSGCYSVSLTAWYSLAGDPRRRSPLPNRGVTVNSVTGASRIAGKMDFPAEALRNSCGIRVECVGSPSNRLLKYQVKIKKRN